MPNQETEQQDRIYLSPPHMSEGDLQLLTDAFRSNWIAPLGPHVDAFEQEFAEKMGGGYAVALSSGTAALHLALQIVGVQPDDEVLVSTLTFIASANAIRYCGAKPVFIDSERKTWNLDPNLLAEELREADKRGRLPSAVMVVDVLGQCADYEDIVEVCQRYEVPLVEDAAEALGAEYRGKPAGTFGDIGCFSFNGNKIITTSGGGMLVTDIPSWAAKARHLASQAREPAPHYEHSQIGFNYRLSNLLAAVGRGQLAKLEDRVACRRRVFEYYREALLDVPAIRWMPEPEDCHSTRWLTSLIVEPEKFGCSSESIRLALEEQNIEARPVWKPMHLQPVNNDCRYKGGQVAENIFRQGLCLPSGSNLTESNLRRIVSVLRTSISCGKLASQAA